MNEPKTDSELYLMLQGHGGSKRIRDYHEGDAAIECAILAEFRALRAAIESADAIAGAARDSTHCQYRVHDIPCCKTCESLALCEAIQDYLSIRNPRVWTEEDEARAKKREEEKGGPKEEGK